MKIKKILLKYWPALLLILLTIPSFWILFLPGFPATDDGNWMIIRFAAFWRTLADGQFPVRFLDGLNFGYGYPVAEFLYPGFMYAALPFKLFAGFVATVKIVIGLSFIFSAVFTYLWLSKIFSRISAAIGSLIFTYLPYHLFDLYNRGSVGELFAFAWVVFSFWMVEAANPFLLSVGIFLLAISHNTIFILLLPVLFTYAVLRKTILIKQLVVSFLLGILMASFFIIPAIAELGLTNFGNSKIADLSKSFASIELAGYVSFFVLLGATICMFLKKKKDYVVFLFAGILIVSLLLSNEITRPVWQFLPVSFIQFPFRLLSFELFAAAYLSAYIISSIKKFQWVAALVMLLLLGVSSYKFLLPVTVNSYDETFYSTNEATTTVLDEYMPTWVKVKPQKHFEQKIKIVRGEGEISSVSYSPNKISFDYSSDSPSVAQVATIYYPGWQAFADGRQKAIFYENKQGLIELKMISTDKHVNLSFGETPLRIFADVISILAFCVSALIFLKYKNKLT